MLYGSFAEKMLDVIRIQTLVGQETNISSLVNKIIISFRKGFKVRAIIITEHRNLDFSAAILASHTHNVLFVQVDEPFPATNLSVAYKI